MATIWGKEAPNPRYGRAPNCPEEFKTEINIDTKDWPTTLDLSGPQPEDSAFNSVTYGTKDQLKITVKNIDGSVKGYGIRLSVSGIEMSGDQFWEPLTKDAKGDVQKAYKAWLSQITPGGNAIDFFSDNPGKNSPVFKPKEDVTLRNAHNWHDFCQGVEIPKNFRNQVPVGLVLDLDLFRHRNSFPPKSKWYMSDPDRKLSYHQAQIFVKFTNRQTRFTTNPAFIVPSSSSNQGSSANQASASAQLEVGPYPVAQGRARPEKLPNINQAMPDPPVAATKMPQIAARKRPKLNPAQTTSSADKNQKTEPKGGKKSPGDKTMGPPAKKNA